MTYIDDIAAKIRAQIDPAQLPGGTHLNDLFRVYALLALTTGTETTLANVHDAWAMWMLGQDVEHDSIEPFCDLDRATQLEDAPFRDAIVAVAGELDQPR